MPKECARTSGGKGNMGMFIERDRKVFAAGLPSAQADICLAGDLQQYSLQDEVDALIHDSIIPPKSQQWPNLRHAVPCDKRNAGIYNEGADLINPSVKTKFQTLVADFKETVYSSYWKKQEGRVPDHVPFLPQGFQEQTTTFGTPRNRSENLFDTVFPPKPIPGQIPKSKLVSVQTCRNYCRPAFDPDRIYGHKANQDKTGRQAKCCITDDRIYTGISLATPITAIQANFKNTTEPKLGRPAMPINNVDSVPKGFSFGKVFPNSENVNNCLTSCEINQEKETMLKCISHLNTVRICMSKRFETTFFRQFFLEFKFFDKCKTGWLPKELVYDACHKNLIRLEPKLIEPLLIQWKAFDGSQINYQTFIHILNFKQPYPDLSKFCDIKEQCLDFSTTYREMVKPGQELDNRGRAGLPSGRYFDKDYPVTPNLCCKAHITFLPEETDASICLRPSILSTLGVSHRDMYSDREPQTVRKVFEACGHQFTDESFDAVWREASRYHTAGLVSFETFRRALDAVQISVKNELK